MRLKSLTFFEYEIKHFILIIFMKKSKAFTLVEIMVVVVIIGLLATIAVPAFNKVRSTAREKAMINNLRQIASAAQQYLVDNGSTSSVSYNQLVSAGYLKSFTPAADENYAGVTVQDTSGSQTISVASANLGKTVTYSF